MATKIPLPTKSLTSEQEQWLAKNAGPRMHYLHNSIGGQGWLVKREWLPGMTHQEWWLTLEDDKLATFFAIKFST
jgi:hypothetical protein